MNTNPDYECKECGYQVLYRSDHREACSYGLPVLNHAIERREVYANMPSTNAAYAETPYTHPSMPGTPPDPYYNVNPQ